MSDLVPVDELIPAPPIPEVDVLIPKPQVGQYHTFDGRVMDEEFARGRKGAILDAFGVGAKQGWGHRPLGDTQAFEKDEVKVPGWIEQTRKLGLFNEWDKHEAKWWKTANEILFRGAATAVDLAFRAPMALGYGGLNTLVEGRAIPRDVAGMIEAFPAGRATGLPTRGVPNTTGVLFQGGRRGQLAAEVQGLEQARNLTVELQDARRLGLLGEGTQAEARVAFAPEGVESATERVVRGPEPVPVVEPEPAAVVPTDVHGLARMIAPDTFKVWDELTERRDALTQWIDEQRALRDAPAQARIDDILGKVNGVEARLTNRAATRLELARRELEEIQAVDTPAMAAARLARQDLDFEMRDLAPTVAEATREAQRQMPVPEVETGLAPARDPVVVPITQALDAELRAQGWMAEAIEQMGPAEKQLAVEQGRAAAIELGEAPARQIVELSQRRPTIAREVENQLVAAGRPREEAVAHAAIVQAHYEARAARFQGALGRARDLYEREGPTVVGAESAARRGGFNLARNEIGLFRTADASTFMHESAHSWLEEMKRDALHEAAPASLKADLQTVKEWLGAEDTFTRAQHEKFARGFERYLMEGQAPSSRLAKVFEQLKTWLTQLYQTVSRLRAPITNDIRGVYDRLLAAPTKEPVIVPERPGAVDFATHAETVARETPAVDAAQAAEQLLAERERVAQLLSRVVDDVRREAKRGPQRVVLPEREGTGGEPASPRESVAAADGTLRPIRNPPTGTSTAPRTASEPFGAVDGPLVDKAGNIRIENLNVPEDVAVSIRAAAEEGGGFVEARRNVLRDDEVLDLADDLGMSPKRLDRRRIGEAFNAEEILAARRLLVRSATEVRDAMAKAAIGDEQGIIAYAIARERHLMIQEQVAGITAEAGRALRAFRQIEGMTDAKSLTDFFQKNIRKTPEALQREAQMGLKLDSAGQVGKFVREQAKPTWKDMTVEAWLSSLLSGPFTHIRNIAGNTTVALNAIAETGVAAGVSKVLGHTEGREFAEVGDRLWGLGQGSIDGVRGFAKAMTDETYALEKEARIDERAFRRAIPSVNVGGIEVPVGQAIRLPLRLLAAEDEFFKAVAFRQELNVLARRTARLEGLEGTALDSRIAELILDPTDEMVIGAAKFAEYQTFTNQLGPQGRAIQQWADTHPFARFAVPFIRTPTNIVKYAGERTPFGLASRRIRDEIMGRYGEARQADAIARMALGTTVMTAVGVLAFNGLVTGGGPTRPEEINTLRQTGWQPYSLKIGDTYVSYRGMDPLSFPLAIAADLVEVAQRLDKEAGKEDPQYERAATMAAVNLAGHDATEKLAIRTLANAILAIFEPEQHGQRFINSMVGTIVPGAVSQTAQIGDPIMRDTRGLVDTLRARIGMRQGLMPRRDVWGELIPQADVGPVQVSQETTDPVRLEVMRLGMTMSPADHKINNVELTPEQYDQYVRESGRLAKMNLDDLIEKPSYQNAPDGSKKMMIKKQIDGMRKAARAHVIMESMGTENDLVEKGKQKRLEALR